MTEIQGAVEAKIDELSDHFERQLKILQEAEQPLHLPFANEMIRVRVVRRESNGGEVVEYQEVALRERIKDFQKLAIEKHDVLQDLMDQWVDTQRDLLQLSAEILGGEALKLDDKQLYPDLLAALRAGEEEHDKNESQYQDIILGIEPLVKQVNDMTAETKKSATKLDKVFIFLVIVKAEADLLCSKFERPKRKSKSRH